MPNRTFEGAIRGVKARASHYCQDDQLLRGQRPHTSDGTPGCSLMTSILKRITRVVSGYTCRRKALYTPLISPQRSLGPIRLQGCEGQSVS
jgi:hypothetical protein